MSRGWRRTIVVASALLAALAAARWGGSWALNRYISSRFGSRASTFMINPLDLSAYSPAGKASIGGFPIAWKELRIRLWGGRLAVGALLAGDENSPAARAESISASHLFGTPVVWIKKGTINPLNPLWRGLLKQSGETASSSAAVPDFALWVEEFRADTVLGQVSGSLYFGDGQNGARRPFVVSLSDGQGDKGAFEGSWGKEGTISGKIRFSGGEAVLYGGFSRGELSLHADLATRSGDWRGDLTGDDREWRCILLQDSRASGGTGWLYGSLDRSGEKADAISNVRLLSNGITLREANLGADWSLCGIKLHAENFNTDISNKANTNCLSLSGDGILKSAAKGVMLPIQVNLNWTGGGVQGVLGTVSLGEGSGVPLKNYLSKLRATIAVDGFSGPETSLEGSFEGGGFRGWAAGNGTSSQGEAHFDIAASYAAGFANLTWGDSGLSCQFGGTMSHQEPGDWPLPRGRWTFDGSASWTKGEAYPSLKVAGREGGGARLNASFSGGNITADGTRLSLASSWGTITDAAFSVKGLVGEGSLKKAEAKFTAGGATLGGGPPLARISFDAGFSDGDISGKASSLLPSLDGEFAFGFVVSDGDFSKLRLTGGSVHLLKGEIRLLGVEAGGLAAWPKPVSVKAAKSFLFGEESGPLAGSITSADNGSIVVAGKGLLLGGEANFAVHPGGNGYVEVSGSGFDSSKLVKFASRWAPLPFSAVSGPADAAVTIPLEGVPAGIKGAVNLRKVTLNMGDERHQFRNAKGTIRFEVAAEDTSFSSESLSLESDKLPLQITGKSAQGVVTMDVKIPESDAAEVQNAFFDFLPEYVGFGTMAGRMGATARLVSDSRDKVLTMNLAFHGAEFTSEDKALSLQGIEGSLPLSISLGLGALPARRGFRAPDEKSVASAYGAYAAPLENGEPMLIQSAAFSVYSMENIGLSSNLTEDGATDIRINRGVLWDGGVHGEFRVGVSSGGLGYSGQLLFNEISLRDLCNQAGGLTGFIGGRLSGHVTFGADKFGLAALKMVAGFAVDPAGDEPMVIGRDFLVKIGGAQMKRLVPTRFLNYDKAQIGFAVRSGSLTVSKLVLEHEANPIKSILRKDISFEIRVPFNNSISIYQLLDSIKGLQERPATVQ